MTHRTATQGGAMTLEKGLAAFVDAMLGKNRSAGTLRAYKTDVLQFMTFLHANNVAITGVADVGKVDVLEGFDHGIGHFMLFEVDSKAQAPAPPMPKSPRTSSAASDRKSAPQPSSCQAG